MRILLVEDEVHLSEAICHLLKQNKYSVDAVYDGIDGYDYIMSDIYDIVVLDVMLPGMNGFEILKKVREEGMETPIIMLTAKSEISDKVVGLDKGADDYLTKPFATEELLARLRALGRRKGFNFESDEIILGDLQYDKQNLRIIKNNQHISLSHLENQLFELLVDRRKMITSKEQIIVKLWGYDSEAEDNNVEVYVSLLRKKLRALSSNVTIKTTRNVGYNLEVDNHV